MQNQNDNIIKGLSAKISNSIRHYARITQGPMYSGDLAYPYRQGISTLNSCSSHKSCQEMDHENGKCDQ